MATYGSARRHGAGIVLTDGTQFFKISDWSDAAAAVYGWQCTQRGDVIGEYQRLPDGLQFAEDPA